MGRFASCRDGTSDRGGHFVGGRVDDPPMIAIIALRLLFSFTVKRVQAKLNTGALPGPLLRRPT
jgi:hypothetical protein